MRLPVPVSVRRLVEAFANAVWAALHVSADIDTPSKPVPCAATVLFPQPSSTAGVPLKVVAVPFSA